LQAIVLYAFNDLKSQYFSINEIEQRTGMDSMMVKRVLHSLSNQQHRILRKVSMETHSIVNQGFSSDKGFAVNLSFRSRLIRTRVPMPSAAAFENNSGSHSGLIDGNDNSNICRGPSAAVSSLSQSEIAIARRQAVEACIVRLLKGRKCMYEAEILAGVQARTAQTFIPDLLLVKKCLTTLMDKEYIEASTSVPGQYIYCP
jgi:cullin 3